MSDKKPSSELISAREGGVFSLWDMPSFDEPEVAAEPEAIAAPPADVEEEVRVEDVVMEDVKPLTLEDVEAVRQDAWNEGFSAGEKEGFHTGQLKAAQEAEVVLRNKVQALENIMHELFEPIASQDQQLEDRMLELIMHISRQVIQRELSIDSSQIKQVVRESLKLLPMGSESVRVYVNPQDFEQIKALRERHEENWKIIEDDELLPGGCRFDSVNTQINATIETRIEQIASQILEQQRELQGQPLEADIDVALDAVAPEPEAIVEPEPEPEPEPESSAAVDTEAAADAATLVADEPAPHESATEQAQTAESVVDPQLSATAAELDPAPEAEPMVDDTQSVT